MSSSSTTLSLDHLPPSEQLCYVHCTICDTILAVISTSTLRYFSSLYLLFAPLGFLSPIPLKKICVQYFWLNYHHFPHWSLSQVSVPCTSLFKTVTVRCGHCTNLLPVNMRGLLLPSSPNQFHLGHSFFSPSHNLLVLIITMHNHNIKIVCVSLLYSYLLNELIRVCS